MMMKSIFFFFSAVTAYEFRRFHVEEPESKFVFVSPDKKNWVDAKMFCVRRQTEIWLPQSPEDMDAGLAWMETQCPKKPQGELPCGRFWVGATDASHEGKWTTERDSSGSEVHFQPWKENEPNNHGEGEDCVVMSSQDGWNDTKCDSNYVFACVMPKTTTTTTTTSPPTVGQDLSVPPSDAAGAEGGESGCPDQNAADRILCNDMCVDATHEATRDMCREFQEQLKGCRCSSWAPERKTYSDGIQTAGTD